MTEVLEMQIGGSHYKDMAIQPVQMTQRYGFDFCSASVLKYISRHRKKNGRQDLLKALHFMSLRAEIHSYPPLLWPPDNLIRQYVDQFSGADRDIVAVFFLWLQYDKRGAMIGTDKWGRINPEQKLTDLIHDACLAYEAAG